MVDSVVIDLQNSLEDREHLMRAVHLLYIMSASNEGRTPKLPYTEFHNKEVSKRADLGQEYMIWRHILVRLSFLLCCRSRGCHLSLVMIWPHTLVRHHTLHHHYH